MILISINLTETSKVVLFMLNFCRNLRCHLAQCQIGLLFFPLHYCHSFRDGLGVKKSNFYFLQINLFSFCARIEPKLNKLQKTVKIDKKSSKKPCFLVVFWSLLNFGSILAQKHTKCKYLSIVPFFCHPGHPWSCESSGVITTLISLFKIFQQQCHLVTFFNFPKWSLRLT